MTGNDTPDWLTDVIVATLDWLCDVIGVGRLGLDLLFPLLMQVIAMLSGAEHELELYGNL
ncbi:MAG TPA: hypothetical protein VGG84_10335 [Gemmatimonadaceae bacterium]